MKPTIRLTLPYPPSVNHYWQASGKRRFISKAGREFTAKVIEIVKYAGYKSLGDARLAISVMIHPRSKRRFDLDNTLKAILDSLMKAELFDDDNQFDFIEIMRGEEIKGGQAVVHIYEYEA